MANCIRIGFLKLGAYSSKFYINEIERISKKFDTPYKLTVQNVDFEDWNQFLPYGFVELKPRLKKALLKLDNNDIDVIVIPNITLHFTLDKLNLDKKLINKIIHPINETLSFLKRRNIKLITLLGTKYTMDSTTMKSYFESENIKFTEISSSQIANCDNVRTSVFKEGVSKENKENFKSLII